MSTISLPCSRYSWYEFVNHNHQGWGSSKGSFYIAQYPVRWTAQSALHFPPLADMFIPTPFSASLGSILARQQLRAKTKSLTFLPLSIARYSFIQLSQQYVNGENENAQSSKRYQRGIRTRAHTIASRAFYH